MTRLFFFTVFLFFFLPAQSQELTDSEREQIDQIVHWNLRDAAPGLAVGIVRAGEIVYEFYGGLEDLKSEEPIDESTVFNIASNAKQFTACLILELIQEGQIQLADDFRKTLPEILPNYPKSITVQQLLNHSSGIRDVYDLWDIQGIIWWKTKGLNNEQALALISQQQAPQFEPGAAFSYSNSNYLLLAEIVARLTGKPFAIYAQERFREWGLKESFFLANHNREITHLAKPYFDFGKWYYYHWRSSLYGDGALFTTLRDQLQWESKLQTELEHSTLLPASQQALPIQGEERYGYGLEFDTYRGLFRLRHEGTTGAWQAAFMRFPAQELAIVVMSNSGAVNPKGVARRLADKLLADELLEERPFPQGPEVVESDFTDAQLTGTYALENGYYFRIRKAGNQWLLERPSRDPITIEREQGDLFHERDDPAFKQYFARNEQGEQTVTAFYPTHNPFTLTKLADFPANFQAEHWVGEYRNVDTDVTVQLIDRGQNNFVLKFQGGKRQKRRGTLMSPTIMNAQGYRLQYSEVDGRKQFVLSNNRVRGLQFLRVE